MNPRDVAIKAALMESTAKNRDAITKSRARRSRTRPWQVLEEHWYECHFNRFGKDCKPTKWGVAEQQLARKFLDEVNLEDAEKAIRVYFERWRKEGTPGMRLFWVERGSFTAQIAGRADTKQDVLSRGEFDAEGAEATPKVGW